MATKKGGPTKKADEAGPPMHSATRHSNDTPAVTHALRCAARGGRVVPCNLHKKPLISGYTKGTASPDPEQIRRWSKLPSCAGFALLCGSQSGEVVVDVDAHRNGALATLDLPPTFTVTTPHGGTHHHYRMEGEVRTNPNLAEGIELLGDDHLVMLPGSKFALEGGLVVEYRLKSRVQRVAPLPPRLIRPAKSTPERLGDGAGGDVLLEGDRNTSLASLAGKMRRADATEDEILLALRAWRDSRCERPETVLDSELEATARSYASYAGGFDSRVADRVEDLRVNEQARLIVNAPARLWTPPDQTMDEYLDSEDEVLVYTVAGLHVTGGVTMLNARAKVGKTTMTVNLAKALIDGEPFLGEYAIDFPDGNVHIWDYEMIPAQYKEWLRRRGIEHLRDRMVPPWHLSGEPNPLHDEEAVAEWLMAHNVKAWIIDSASEAYSDFVDNDNSASQMIRFTAKLDRIKAMAGVRDLFVLAHMGATYVTEGNERARGSTRLDDWPSMIWNYTSDKGVRSLTAKGRGPDLEAQTLQFNPQTLELRTIGSRKEIRDDDNALTAVIKLLGESEAPTSGEFTKTILTKASERDGYPQALKRGWIETYPDKTRSARAQFVRVTEAGLHATERRAKVVKK